MAVYYGEHELSWNNREEVLKLPVNPTDPPEYYIPGNNVNYDTTEVGTFKAIGYPGLETVTISSFFPAHNYKFCTYSGFPSPEECVAQIKKWQNTRRPIRYINTGVNNDAYAIESFSYKKEMGTGDIYYELALERYRFYNDINNETGNMSRFDDTFSDTLHTFVTLEYGQTLCELAEEWLGDSDRYKDIAEWNEIDDVGHPWSATEGKNHQLEIICEEGTPGYKLIQDMAKGAVG